MALLLKVTLHGEQRQLPLVLCGPILRRTTPDSVTVWVATHSACSVRLIIRGSAGIVFENTTFTGTIKIGKHLHIACVTAQTNNPAEYLKWGEVYHYGLQFDLGDLGDDNVCSSNSQAFKDDFCYGHDYPGFVIPPDAANLDSLRVAHGSCRKPHGEGLDALSCLDTLIKDNYNNPVMRPQLLCLTGDQIYADDVDDHLIEMIEEVAREILGYAVGKTGDRTGIVQNINFTSDDAKNHLLGFAEFAAMYLLVWSEVLWPLDISGASDELDSFYKSLKAVRRALANIPIYMVFDDHEITDDWNRTLVWRVLTYCPTFNNGPSSVEVNWAAHSIIANGLLAYALFQGWGNLGAQADNTTPFKEIISNCPKKDEKSTQTPGEDVNTLFDLQTLMLPIGNTDGKWAYLKYPDGNMPWSFRVEYPGLQIIGLDSRNLRGYRTAQGAPAVIYPDNIKPQLGSNYTLPLTIVLCGAPLFGVEAIETGQDWSELVKVGNFQGDEYLDKEAWAFDMNAFHEMQVELGKFKKVIVLSGDVHYGFSAQVQFWDDSDPSVPQSAIIAQCCSSALKN